MVARVVLEGLTSRRSSVACVVLEFEILGSTLREKKKRVGGTNSGSGKLGEKGTCSMT